MSPLLKATRIAIYLHGRPGTHSSPEHLDFQRKEIECFLHIWRSRAPVSVVETYEDVDPLNRDSGQPALKRLLVDMDSGKFDCVIAYNLERFGQTLVTYEQLLARFKKCGLGLATPQPWIFHVLGKRFLDITGWHPLSSHPRAIAKRRRLQMEVEKVEDAMRTKCLKADGRDDLLQFFA